MDQTSPPGLLSSLQRQFLMDDTQEDKISPKIVNCSMVLQGTGLLSDSAATAVLRQQAWGLILIVLCALQVLQKLCGIF